MLDFVYTLLIAPLEYWMHAALVWGYSHTQSWGPAIVVMSLAVNLVILPIYIKAERWQEDERALRKSFEAKESMIKRTFRGQERFAMMSTMHRQAGYSPFLSLRSSLGFFLQIPFFFAAYHFLSHFEPLAGVSFLGIADLSRPDAMMALGGVSVNVLPIVMTFINVLSALVYTHNMTARDKMQLYGMAALFLVLLYDAASGLVLYWTCNNIFSLGKNIVYSLLERCRPVAQAALRLLRARGRSPAEEHFAGGAVYSTAFWLWAGAAVLALASSNQAVFVSEALKNPIGLSSDFLFLASLLVAAVLAIKVRLWRHHPVLTLVLLAAMYYAFKVWGNWFFAGANRKSFALAAGFLFLIPALSVWHAGVDLRRYLYSPVHSLRSKKPPKTLLGPASFWLMLLLAAYLPVQAYTTAVETFSSPDVILAKSLFWCALIGVPLWLFAFAAYLLRSLNFAGYLLGAVTLVLTVYAFVLPLDAGTIDAFRIADASALFAGRNLLVDALVLTLTLGVFGALVRAGHAVWIRGVFVLCIVGALVNGTYLLWQCRGQWNRDEGQTTQAALPDYNDRLFGFSKNGRNVLVVMLDAFTGTHMRSLLKADPALADKLAGFVWYPDTVSAGQSTDTGVASVLCGAACTPQAINAQEGGTVADKVNARYAALVDRLGPDWQVALHERNWLEPMRLRRHTDADVLALRYLSPAYTDRYVKSRGLTLGRGDSDEFLLAVSVFSAVPWSGKNLIYRDGRWFESFLGQKEEVLALRALKDWALLDQLPELSNADASKNTFKFIATELTHAPWFMDPGKCAVTTTPQRALTPEGLPLAHLATETCALKALAEWFDWMKRAGVWDNTTVVLASDHSCGDDPQFNRRFEGMSGAPIRANALLMVRQAGDNKPFAIDFSPMSAAKVAARWTGQAAVEPRRHVQGRSRAGQYLIERVWTVKGSMFDKDSWHLSQP